GIAVAEPGQHLGRDPGADRLVALVGFEEPQVVVTGRQGDQRPRIRVEPLIDRQPSGGGKHDSEGVRSVVVREPGGKAIRCLACVPYRPGKVATGGRARTTVDGHDGFTLAHRAASEGERRSAVDCRERSPFVIYVHRTGGSVVLASNPTGPF